MRNITLLFVLSSSILLATELPTGTAALSAFVCISFDISTKDGITSLHHASSIIKKKIPMSSAFVTLTQLESDLQSATADRQNSISANNRLMASFQKSGSPFDQWHTIITRVITHAQKKKYSLDAVQAIVATLDEHAIKTGWHYTILTNENTEQDKLKQRIICFGMSMDMNNTEHWQTQFVIAPLKKNGNGNQLINNI